MIMLLRGGSWDYSPWHARASVYGRESVYMRAKPSQRFPNNGFRTVFIMWRSR